MRYALPDDPMSALLARTLTTVAPCSENRAWIARSIASLVEESAAADDTPMRELRLPGFPEIRFLLKDESVHATGSLKHRLARSLFLYALCNGCIRRGQALVDASSGSTAISARTGLPQHSSATWRHGIG